MPQRRVVTGHDPQGRSVILLDGASPNSAVLAQAGGLTITELWETTTTPADNSGGRDAALRAPGIEPHGVGSVFRIIEYPPDRLRLKTLDAQNFFAGMGVSHSAEAAQTRHPGMHKTDTVDYAIVLSGEIYAMMDEGETLLRAGDVLIQRGTRHAWSNRTDAPCVIAFVLISAAPI